MHEHKEHNNKTIKILIEPTVMVSHLAPSPLGQDLHQQILRVSELLKVRKLNILVVVRLLILNLLSGVENLHPHNPENKEYYRENQKKPSDNRKDLSKGLEQPPQLRQNLRVTVLKEFTVEKSPKEKAHPKHPTNNEQVVNITISRDEEKQHVQQNQKSIQIVPTVGEVSLRTQRHHTHQQLTKKQPNKNPIEYSRQKPDLKQVKNCVHTTKQSHHTHHHVKQPMLNDILEPNGLID